MSAAASSALLPRTADAVREVLAEHRPDLHDAFVAEFHTAIAETDDDFDTERITRLIGRWWAQAAVGMRTRRISLRCSLFPPHPGQTQGTANTGMELRSARFG